MKSFIDSIKAVAVGVGVALIALLPTVGNAGQYLLVTPSGASTNHIVAGGTGRIIVKQIDVMNGGATASLVKFFDSSLTNLEKRVTTSFSYPSNFTLTITNLQTNAIFVYDTSTNYLIQTNYSTANYRSNITVTGFTNVATPLFTAFAPAGGIASGTDLDIIVTRHLIFSSTNSVTIVVTTLDN